jgi:hypothetical protein
MNFKSSLNASMVETGDVEFSIVEVTPIIINNAIGISIGVRAKLPFSTKNLTK